MELALYGDDGFYTSNGSAGRRGDFITSPEVGPLFGAVIARALDAWWREFGEPHGFTVVEVGAGPGTLARSILDARPACLESGRYVAVEVSDVQRARHPEGVTSQRDMPDGPFVGVIIANELLDNLPFDLCVYDNGWREAWVAANGDSFVEVLRPLSNPSPLLPAVAVHGARVPVQAPAGEWLRDALGRLSSGRVLLFDYCSASTAVAAASPWREWLRTYVGHERGADPLADPGSRDITADVAIDQLALDVEPTVVTTQRDWLVDLGIEGLVDEGRRMWRERATAPDVVALRARSRVGESEALLEPEGLGGFVVLEWHVDTADVPGVDR